MLDLIHIAQQQCAHVAVTELNGLVTSTTETASSAPVSNACSLLDFLTSISGEQHPFVVYVLSNTLFNLVPSALNCSSLPASFPPRLSRIYDKLLNFYYTCVTSIDMSRSQFCGFDKLIHNLFSALFCEQNNSKSRISNILCSIMYLRGHLSLVLSAITDSFDLYSAFDKLLKYSSESFRLKLTKTLINLNDFSFCLPAIGCAHLHLIIHSIKINNLAHLKALISFCATNYTELSNEQTTSLIINISNNLDLNLNTLTNMQRLFAFCILSGFISLLKHYESITISKVLANMNSILASGDTSDRHRSMIVLGCINQNASNHDQFDYIFDLGDDLYAFKHTFSIFDYTAEFLCQSNREDDINDPAEEFYNNVKVQSTEPETLPNNYSSIFDTPREIGSRNVTLRECLDLVHSSKFNDWSYGFNNLPHLTKEFSESLAHSQHLVEHLFKTTLNMENKFGVSSFLPTLSATLSNVIVAAPHRTPLLVKFGLAGDHSTSKIMVVMSSLTSAVNKLSIEQVKTAQSTSSYLKPMSEPRRRPERAEKEIQERLKRRTKFFKRKTTESFNSLLYPSFNALFWPIFNHFSSRSREIAAALSDVSHFQFPHYSSIISAVLGYFGVLCSSIPLTFETKEAFQSTAEMSIHLAKFRGKSKYFDKSLFLCFALLLGSVSNFTDLKTLCPSNDDLVVVQNLLLEGLQSPDDRVRDSCGMGLSVISKVRNELSLEI
ncbi:hypothetical protein P9112_002570 [Eukaryota sp. TZLM1-RC]